MRVLISSIGTLRFSASNDASPLGGLSTGSRKVAASKKILLVPTFNVPCQAIHFGNIT